MKLSLDYISCEVLLLLSIFKSGLGIGCFTCYSHNSSDPGCEDPYDPYESTYTPNCFVGREERKGLFPAQYCVKVKGRDGNGEATTIRACSFFGMAQQCGVFIYEGVEMTGCVVTCDYDGCNGSLPLNSLSSMTCIVSALLLSVAMSCLLR